MSRGFKPWLLLQQVRGQIRNRVRKPPKLLLRKSKFMIDLENLFHDLNGRFFSGSLSICVLQYNSRLRSSAGRFSGSRRTGARIEIASYLLELPEAHHWVRDTLGHEMIHYWLWARRRPYGHTAEFYAKMNEMGVSRYNSVPKRSPAKYIYRCPGCRTEFKAWRRLRPSACLMCCRQFSAGRFDARFRLEMTWKE